MRFLTKYFGTNEVPSTEKPQPNDTETANGVELKEKPTQVSGGQEQQDKDAGSVSDSGGSSDNNSNTDVQYGVRAAQVSLKVWTRNQMIAAYVLIWIIQFLEAFSMGMSATLTPQVTSAFSMHSLTATTSVISGIIGGLIKFPYAKLIDIWGRPQGFAVMVVSLTLGFIMMAGCNNVGTYCAAQVFYMIGYNGIDFSITIFIADTSSLRNRAFMIAFAASPSLATVWAYGPATQKALVTMGWRWALGMWAIIMPVVCTPLFALFYYNQKKAEKQGLIKSEPSGRTFAQSVIHYMREFDVFGLILISGGLALFLLSFNLYSYQRDGWRAPLIITFIIFGGLLIIAFILYERFLAPVTFIPWSLMKNRTVFFTYSMVTSLYMAWYVWDSYFYSLLRVVFGTNLSIATYIQNIYTVGSCFWSLVMGVIIRFNGRLKWQAMWFGVPITVLGVGLMIKFRQPDSDIGYIAMCMIFISFGGGTLVICEQMTVMAVSSQQNIPAVLAMEAMMASIGGAIGSTISSAMWTGIFPEKLRRLLPPDAPFEKIYGSLDVQISYPPGSPTRIAINDAYGAAQRLMLITATCLYAITWGSVAMWQDINVKNMKKQEDRVF